MTLGFPTPHDIYLFHQGNLFKSYEMLGAQFREEDGKKGVRFSVWAPNAKEISVVGSFNNWNGKLHSLQRIKESGIWSLFIPNLQQGELYKYEIKTDYGTVLLKADPYAFYAECRPKSASVTYDLHEYIWGDQEWVNNDKTVYDKPVNIYEVHLGSWKLKDDGTFYTYRELAHDLVEYVVEMGYTHIQLLPIMEHPYDGSWGYQITGYYAVTSRYGTPHDFMYFVDCCHQRGIGVILDWVPAHFCKDGHGLIDFDGTRLYEAEELQGWGTMRFDYGRPEVMSFLISNAFFWFDIFHVDGLRVDAVASMLYLNYGKEGGWISNKYGGNGNLEAITLLKKLNEAVFLNFPKAMMIAEESTEWALVTGPTYAGGLGFNYKWNMGWMNDVLKYMEKETIYRSWHHNLLTFSFLYAFSENFILPMSHDEVVHGKRSLIEKMPGDYWQKFANLRVFLGYMMTHPGKKLLFMGGELAQFIEWRYYEALEWDLLSFEMHRRFQDYVKNLNRMYSAEKALWQQDHSWEGFEWIDCHNNSQSIIVFLRKSRNKAEQLLVLCNFTPQYYEGFRIGVPLDGTYQEIFNSDLGVYGGSDKKNSVLLAAENIPWHNQPYSLEIKVPPLAFVLFKLS
ncbi:MAG: 1,4-alpha-glucan branching enzyme [Firmicutes bacterium HGW-Firmicutes-12]|nr:MAG: 1,4-alpha-glucan branching enzyme [Firmicutes bacterium HGW-Firmicutes-12]